MAQQTAVDWLAEMYDGVRWSRNRQEISAHQEHKLRKSYLIKAKEMEKHQHGQTWDAAIKAHDDRGHVHARSLVDFDKWYEETFKK